MRDDIAITIIIIVIMFIIISSSNITTCCFIGRDPQALRVRHQLSRALSGTMK